VAGGSHPRGGRDRAGIYFIARNLLAKFVKAKKEPVDFNKSQLALLD
jgi:hypothetical protein